MENNYFLGRKILSFFQIGSWLSLILGVILLATSLSSFDEKLFAALVVIISSLSGILGCIIGSAIIDIAETNQDVSKSNKLILEQLGQKQNIESFDSESIVNKASSPTSNLVTTTPLFLEKYRGHNIYKDRGMYRVENVEFATLRAARSHIDDVTNSDE